MNIFQAIESDHEKVRNILQDLRKTPVKAVTKRTQKLKNLKDEYAAHMRAEEKLFYPLLMKLEQDRELVFEAEEEHQASRNALADLESLPVDNERWKAKLKVLGELIEHHLEEEEDAIFDEAKMFIDPDQAREMGVQFQSLKRETRQ